jgi:hypothetical protein
VVTREELVRLLTVIFANTHPYHRQETARIIDDAARTVLGVSVTPLYTRNTVFPSVTTVGTNHGR